MVGLGGFHLRFSVNTTQFHVHGLLPGNVAPHCCDDPHGPNSGQHGPQPSARQASGSCTDVPWLISDSLGSGRTANGQLSLAGGLVNLIAAH